MTYQEAINYLYGLRLMGAKFGLENTRALARAAGDPQHELRFVHVAGTNGKGSTCAYLERIYREAGYVTGLYTSPHLLRFGERFRIQGEPIGDVEVIERVEQLREWMEGLDPDVHPTFFEATTVMALQVFQDHGCEVVLWETGLGGRLDATNIVQPEVSIITRIGLDHQQWLGNTLREIAGEKAGIFKPGVPALSAPQKSEAAVALKDHADATGTYLRVVAPETGPGGGLLWKGNAGTGELHLGMKGLHQLENAALALAAVEELSDVLPVPAQAVREGICRALMPGRFQVFHNIQGHEVVLDGAHNLDGWEVLQDTWNREYPDRKPFLVMAMLQDKFHPGILDRVAALAAEVAVCPVKSERGAEPEGLVRALQEVAPDLPVRLCRDLPGLLVNLPEKAPILVTGSLHFLGDVMEAWGIAFSGSHQERDLNTWTGSAPAQP